MNTPPKIITIEAHFTSPTWRALRAEKDTPVQLKLDDFGDWLPQWDEAAKSAAAGRYLDNGKISETQRRKGIKPETKFRPDGEK